MTRALSIEQIQIREDDLTRPEIAALVQAHLQNMFALSPPENVHALGVDALRSPDITVWSAWEGVELLGCGALKALDPRSGEIKSMRTAPAHRRRGVASMLLEHIIQTAKQRAYSHLHLKAFKNRFFICSGPCPL